MYLYIFFGAVCPWPQVRKVSIKYKIEKKHYPPFIFFLILSYQAHASFDDQHIPLKSCLVEVAHDYTKKKKNVFRLTSHTECEYLFQTEDKGTMLIWIQAIKSINEPDKAEKMVRFLFVLYVDT